MRHQLLVIEAATVSASIQAEVIRCESGDDRYIVNVELSCSGTGKQFLLHAAEMGQMGSCWSRYGLQSVSQARYWQQNLAGIMEFFCTRLPSDINSLVGFAIDNGHVYAFKADQWKSGSPLMLGKTTLDGLLAEGVCK